MKKKVKYLLTISLKNQLSEFFYKTKYMIKLYAKTNEMVIIFESMNKINKKNE